MQRKYPVVITEVASLNTNKQLYGAISSDEEEESEYEVELKSGPSTWTVVSILGSQFSDISTSPLYTMNTLCSSAKEKDILGAMSVIFYLFTFIVIVKYLLVVANTTRHQLLGGHMAMFSKISTVKQSMAVKVLCIAGCSLMIADGVLTPTTSVLSALSGLPTEGKNILPVGVIILLGVFCGQRWGAARAIFALAPVIFIWLLSLAGIGVYYIFKYPMIIQALNPIYGYLYIRANGLCCLNSAVLAITGAEAIFLDLGRVRTSTVQVTLGCFVYPCLMLSYLGQSAFIILLGEIPPNVFYSCLSSPVAYYAMLLMGTVSAVVTTQELISGLFTIIQQLAKHQCFFRLQVQNIKGNVYIPAINYCLIAGLMLTLLVFEDCNAMTMAYGLTISMDFIVTTLLIILTLVLVYRRVVLAVGFSLFLPVEAAVMYANVSKFGKGGWFPLTVGFIFLCVCLGKHEVPRRVSKARLLQRLQNLHPTTQIYITF